MNTECFKQVYNKIRKTLEEEERVSYLAEMIAKYVELEGEDIESLTWEWPEFDEALEQAKSL